MGEWRGWLGQGRGHCDNDRGSGHFGQELGADDTLSGTLSQTTVPKRKKRKRQKCLP